MNKDYISFSNQLVSNLNNNPFTILPIEKDGNTRQNENVLKKIYDQNETVSLKDKISNTSLIIPFYRKELEFDYAIRKNMEQYRSVKEVIVIFDEPYDMTKFDYLLNYNINFVFLMNKEKHPWRNPSVVINEGIKRATGVYCIVLSPETILIENALNNLLKYTTDFTFCCGSVWFMNYDYYELEQIDSYATQLFYGSICCKKENFMRVGGYNTLYAKSGWGGEDDDIRNRLINHGIIKLEIKNANVVHLEKERRVGAVRNIIGTSNLYDKFEEIQLKKKDNSSQKKILENMDNIAKFEIKENIASSYKIILLTQAHNEQENIDEFMSSVEKFVDGIIVLDDGSNDNTWDLLDMNKYEKIIMKISKKITSDFENHNMLLNIFENTLTKNNVDVNWFMWLNFNERIFGKDKLLDRLRRKLLSDDITDDILNVSVLYVSNSNNEDSLSNDKSLLHPRIIRHRIDKTPYLVQSNNKKSDIAFVPYESSSQMFPLQINHLTNKE